MGDNTKFPPHKNFTSEFCIRPPEVLLKEQFVWRRTAPSCDEILHQMVVRHQCKGGGSWLSELHTPLISLMRILFFTTHLISS